MKREIKLFYFPFSHAEKYPVLDCFVESLQGNCSMQSSLIIVYGSVAPPWVVFDKDPERHLSSCRTCLLARQEQ